MKKIILNTNNANEVSTDKKNYKYYFDRPVVLEQKSTLSLQSITQKGGLATSSTPNSTGLLHLSGLDPYEVNGTPSTYGWSLNANGYVEEMEIDLNNSSEALVVASDGFTIKTPGIDYNGGKLKCLIYNDTTATFNSPQTLMVISSVTDMGSGFEVGWIIAVKKRNTGVTYTGNLNDPVFQITSVRDSLIFQDGYLLYQESVGAFNPIYYEYAGEVNQTLDAGYTSPNVDLGQGLIVRFRTNTSNPSLIEIDTISSGGYGYTIGTDVYVNKKDILPSSSGTDFLLPLKLFVISNTVTTTPQPIYDEGLLTIRNLEIDYSTIPTSIYGSFSYVGEFLVDLNDNTKCSVFRSNGGASVGVDAELKFFTFIDYPTPSFPRTTVIGQVTSFGKNYRVGDYIIINQTAFPTGYIASGTSVNMRVNITDVSTSEITQYPKGIITALDLDAGYSGEVGSNTNYTHSSVNNGQLTQFIWGSGSSAIELKQIVNGGVGFSNGDIFFVNKNDSLPTSSTYLVPFKVTVNGITNTVTPPPPNPDGTFKITAKNLLHINDNIFNSDNDNNVLIYNKENSLFVNRDELINYRICDLPPQVLMGFQLYIESTTGIGLSQNDTLIIDLKIS